MSIEIKISKEAQKKVFDSYKIAYNTKASVIETLQGVMDNLNTVITNPEIQKSLEQLKEVNESHVKNNNKLEEAKMNIDANLDYLFDEDTDISKKVEAEVEK